MDHSLLRITETELKNKSYLNLVNKQYDTLYLLALVQTFVEDKSDEMRQFAKELLSYLIAFSITKKTTVVSDQRMIMRIEELEVAVPSNQ